MKTVNYLLKLTFALSMLMLIASGCSKDDEQVTPIEPQPDGEALDQSYADVLDKAMQNFTLDADSGGSVEGEHGTKVTFNANSFVDADGNEVTGDVDIELIEILNRADMLLSDKTTQGRQEDGSIATLVSGGEFYVNAKKEGEQLQLKDGQSFNIVVPTDTLDQAMQLFVNEDKECLDPDCDVVWEEEKNRMEIGDTPNGAGLAYYGFVSNFGWTNIDRWYSDPRPKTTLFVDVPEGYDGSNCSVYLTYDGEPTALARFDVYDEETELFTEHYGQIPIGLEVHFIMVTIIDGQYYYAIQGATIEENHVEVMGDLSPTTEAELTQMIEDLP